MSLIAIHHVQLAMPEGGEDDARAFYEGILGVPEIEKPEPLKSRGGCWFAIGGLQIHLGVEQDFRPARKAHPAFLIDELKSVCERIASSGFEVSNSGVIDGFERAHIFDPFGNRIELMQEAIAIGETPNADVLY